MIVSSTTELFSLKIWALAPNFTFIMVLSKKKNFTLWSIPEKLSFPSPPLSTLVFLFPHKASQRDLQKKKSGELQNFSGDSNNGSDFKHTNPARIPCRVPGRVVSTPVRLPELPSRSIVAQESRQFHIVSRMIIVNH